MDAIRLLNRAALVSLLLIVSGCKGAGETVEFGSVSPQTTWRQEWRPESSYELEFPTPPRSFSTDREQEMAVFLNDTVRIGPEALVALRDVVLVATDLQGRFSALRYNLTPLRSDQARSAGGLYQLRIRQEGLDASSDTILELDHRFRLHDLQSRITPLRDAEGLTVMQSIARWESSVGGYRVASDVGEEIVTAKEPLIPEEALGVLGLLCPRSAKAGRFSAVSTGYKGIYPVDLTIRPSARQDDRSLVQIMSRSPLGREWTMVVQHGAQTRYVHGQDASGARIYPGNEADWNRVSGLVATVIRERAGELIFDGQMLYSSYRADGSHIGPMGSVPSQLESNQSWLQIDGQPLNMTVLSPGRNSGELLKMINRSYQGASPVARGLLNVDEIRLSIALDLLPPGMDIEAAGGALIASLQHRGMEFRVSTTPMTVGGQPAIRIDVMQDVRIRQRGGVAGMAEQYHAFLLVEHDGALLQLQLTAGGEWRKRAAGISEMFASVRFKRPSATDLLGMPRDIRASGE